MRPIYASRFQADVELAVGGVLEELPSGMLRRME